MNTYPLPPAPGWSKETQQDGGWHHHFGRLGAVGPADVWLGRSDHVGATSVEVGPVEVHVDDNKFTPAEARELAALLLHAADMAEQG
jgi:hypothetical protein